MPDGIKLRNIYTTYKTIPSGQAQPQAQPSPAQAGFTPPQSWGAVRYRPITVKDKYGQDVEALVDTSTNTILRGNEQLGTYQPETVQSLPTPPTRGAQLGEAGKQIGLAALEGLSWAFKPFEYVQDYAINPLVELTTMPWWSKLAPQITPGELTWDDIKALFPEGEYAEAYHEWKAPKFLKGTLEILPWFLIPSAGSIAGGLSKLGKVGQAASKVLTPYVAAEKLMGKIISVPIKQAGKVIKKVTAYTERELPGLQNVDEMLAETKSLHPNLLRPSKGLAVTTKQIERYKIDKAWNEAEMARKVISANDNLASDTIVQQQASIINRRGTAEQVFELRKMPVEGRANLPFEEKVTARWIRPGEKGDSMYLGDILEYPERYIIDNSVRGQEGKLWIKAAQVELKATRKLHAQNAVENLDEVLPATAEVDRKFPRRVIAQYDLETGRELWSGEPRAGGSMGGKIAADKPRKFTGPNSQKKAIELGFRYEPDPVQPLTLYSKGVYNQMSVKRQLDILKIPYETPTQRMKRMGGDIDDRIKQIDESIKYLGGGVIKATKPNKLTGETQVFLRKKPGVKRLIASVKRGEVPAGSTVAAIERRFPELGQKLRNALDITDKEFDEVLNAFSAEVMLETGITKSRFREAITEIRLKANAKKPLTEVRTPPVPAIGEKITQNEIQLALDSIGVSTRKQIRFLKQLYANTYKLNKAERNQALDSLMQDVKNRIASLRIEKAKGMPAYRKAKVAAENTSLLEGRLTNLPGWQNVIIPAKTEWGVSGRQIADDVNRLFTPEKVNPIISTASTAARIGVTLTAALDASLIFIQGPLALGYDVQKWSRLQKSGAFLDLTKGFIKTLYKPGYQNELRAANADLLNRFGLHGLAGDRLVDYARPDIIQKYIKKIPVAGGPVGWIFRQSYGRAGEAFGAGSLAARINIIKYGEKSFLEAGWSMRQIAEFANKITGVIDPSTLGVSATKQALLSAGLFSPNYTRAYLMILRDTLRGGMTASEVRKSLAGMLGAGLLGYVGLSELIGQEPKLNPAPKALGGDGAGFMSFKIGNSVIGLPGFWYSAIRMMVSVAAAAEQDPEKLLSLNWRDNDFLKFWMSKSSPLASLSREIIERKDYLGRNINSPGDWMDTLGTHFLTIAGQNLITRNPGEEEGKFKRFGAELFGLRTYPTSEWTKVADMRDTYANQKFDTSWDSLNQEQKGTIRKEYLDFADKETEARENMTWESGEDYEIAMQSASRQAEADYHSMLEDAAQGLVSGVIDYKTYLNQQDYLRRVYSGTKWTENYLQSFLDHDRAKDISKWQSENEKPEDAALSRYWDIRNNPVTVGGVPDWDATEAKTTVYLDSLDSEKRSYILRNKGAWVDSLPPLAKKLAELQTKGRDIVDEYYNIEAKQRIAYRRANPTVDAWLLLMGRVTVPQTQMAMMTATKELQQRGLPLTMIPRLTGQTMPQGTQVAAAKPRIPMRSIAR